MRREFTPMRQVRVLGDLPPVLADAAAHIETHRHCAKVLQGIVEKSTRLKVLHNFATHGNGSLCFKGQQLGLVPQLLNCVQHKRGEQVCVHGHGERELEKKRRSHRSKQGSTRHTTMYHTSKTTIGAYLVFRLHFFVDGPLFFTKCRPQLTTATHQSFAIDSLARKLRFLLLESHAKGEGGKQQPPITGCLSDKRCMSCHTHTVLFCLLVFVGEPN